MMTLFKKSILQITLITFFLCFKAGVSSQIPVPDTSYLQELDPNTGVVSIQQVTFVFDSGIILDSDWGQIQIDPDKWIDSTGIPSGYLNFFIMGSSILERKWVVRNLYVPSAIVDDCPPPVIEDSTISPNEPSSSVPDPEPINFDPVVTANPLSTYFDLRPNTEVSGRLDNIQGIILVSKQPLPVLSDILNAASSFPAHTISIEQIVVNAEGYRWVTIFPQSIVTADNDISMIGPPPNPPDPGPSLPGDLEFPIEVFQSDKPNVSCAENQCVPMAHANVFAYLQNRYDGIPLVWNLPHDPVYGIGKVTSAGDVLYWIPEPENSLVANVDSFTRRLGVVNAGVGEGSSKCQLIRGAFGYLAEYGTLAQAVFRHQGGAELYGEDESCDDGTVILGGIVSTKEGLYPTWEWMFEQLQLGRGLSMLFGRYNMNGSRTSGHMVRVWGTASYLGKNYIYTLDDQYQGINTYGLRTQYWEVEDVGQPGLAGVPDGRLNMNGTSWEIEFALSVEAVPTLLIP